MPFIPPAGSPLSSFTPPVVGALQRPPLILADQIDPTTGDLSSLTEGNDPTSAAIQWQFTVREGTGIALGTGGHRLHKIRKATDGAQIQIQDEGKRVMRKFEDTQQVENVTVKGATVGSTTATAALEIQCTNTLTERAITLRGGV